jgi:hypothetical protein
LDYDHKDHSVARSPDPRVVQAAAAVMTGYDVPPLLPG